jgi:hypothetical protein
VTASPPATVRALALVLLGAASGCGGSADSPQQRDYALFRELELAREVVIGAEAGWARDAALRLAPRLALQLGRPVRVVDLEAARPGARRVRMLIASPQSPALAGVLAALGERAEVLRDFGRTSDPLGAALLATLPDPLRPTAPLSVCLAQTGSELVDPGRDLDLAAVLAPTWRCGWRLFSGTRRSASSDGDGASAAQRPAALPLSEWIAADPSLQPLADAAAAAAASVEAVFGTPPAGSPELRLRLWSEPEDLARDAGGFARWVCRPASGVLDLVRTPDFQDARAAFVEQYARMAWGDPAQEWLVEGLSVYSAGTWWGSDLERWCARLKRGGLGLAAEELLAPYSRASQHQRGPLRGLLFAVLAERGPEGLKRAWVRGNLVIDDALRFAFAQRQSELAELHGSELDAERRLARRRVQARPFRHGVNLVATCDASRTDVAGFGTRAAGRSLARLAELGADAVAFDWALAVEPAWGRSCFERREPPGAGADDLALAASARAAQALELDVLLKPHLWVSDSGTYAGWNWVHSTEEWQHYFDEQRRSAVHYGLFGELIGAEILCLGAEQISASITRSDNRDLSWGPAHFAWKHERWNELIATARAAFDGGLTYAAHWAGEREGIAFWGELDFVGLDLYAPLAPQKAQGPGDLDLHSVTTSLWLSLIRGQASAAVFGKRLLITEVGFPSAGGDWSQPEVPRGSADETKRALLIYSLSRVLKHWAENPEALGGLFVWNYSIDPTGPGAKANYSVHGDRGAPPLQRVLQLP